MSDAPAAPKPAVLKSVHRWSLAGIAAAAVSVMIAIWLGNPPSPHYRTALGEQRSVQLEDGSVVTLNTNSAIEVALSRKARVVRLVQGEALFDVAHDTSRPFDVVARDVVIRAVGTQFNVDQRDTRTTITVLEGKVRVEDGAARVHVAASEQLVIGGTAAAAPERLRDTAPITSWKERRLIFDNRALGEVAAEFNRYNRRQIVIEDVELRAREVTGVFKANDPEAFLMFLGGQGEARIETAADGTLRVTSSNRR